MFRTYVSRPAPRKPIRRVWGFSLFLLLAAVPAFCPSSRAAEPPGRFRALCVGLRYPGTKDGLRFTTDDVRRVAEAFRRASGFEAEQSLVETLVDDDPGGDKPTVREVLKRLAAMADAAGENDRLVFYFSGHGLLGDGGRSLLVCAGGGPGDAATHLPLADVRDILDRGKARDRLVVIDACHSGGKAAGADELTPDSVALAMGGPSGAKASARPMAWLVSCDAEEKSWEDEDSGHGLFTRYFLEALGEAAEVVDTDYDGVLSVHEIHYHVSNGIASYIRDKTMKRDRRWRGVRQTPRVGMGAGDGGGLKSLALFYYDADAAAGNVAGSESGPANLSPIARAGFFNDEFRDPLAEEGGKLVTHAFALPQSLNPLTTNEAAASSLQAMLVGSLATRNGGDLSRFEPDMAESWSVDDSGTEYVVRLRKNVMWQSYTDPVDGRDVPAKPVTAHDFVFHWETIRNPDVPCEAIRTYYEGLDRVEALDDHTLRVLWKRPYCMSESFTLGMSPLPRHYYRPYPAWDDATFAAEFASSPRNGWLVGTGPYRLVSYDPAAGVVLERDENYYGPKPPILQRRIVRIDSDDEALAAFERGEIDLLGLKPQQWRERTPPPAYRLVTPSPEFAAEDAATWDKRKAEGILDQEYRFEKYQYPSTSWSYVGYNLRNPLFAEREVRTALSMLVDRERILREVYGGLGLAISGPFIPQSPYYNHEIEPPPFDIAAATELLRKHGWEDTDGDGILDKADGAGGRRRFAFALMAPAGSSLSRSIAAIMAGDMQKAGVSLRVEPVAWGDFTERLDRGDFEACTLAWTGGVEGDPYQIWHGSGAGRRGGSNFIGYDSPEANRLLEEGRRTVDKEKRYAIYRRLHEVIARDQPYTFLFAPTAMVAIQKKFRNVRVFKNGGIDSTLLWIPREERRER